ncbi:MAG TPA: universal stress protein [Lamprocystis sp. (in: g-proteobacteria)]|nr:universal stress protein [Lamprocystis sp. (in: g-proteobacteria)]
MPSASAVPCSGSDHRRGWPWPTSILRPNRLGPGCETAGMCPWPLSSALPPYTWSWVGTPAWRRTGPLPPRPPIGRTHRPTIIIFMGTHGRGGLVGLFLGSVAAKVIHLSQVPVTVVK